MDTKIRVPVLVNAGGKLSIGRWFKRLGDPVSLDEPLVEIDTDNVTHEIRSPVTGVLSSISANDGATVEPDTVVGIIADYSATPKQDNHNGL
jgi:pyruvate/2-oxoglutarate dehydrogenase complex dihydrolipoamide acyltransferase (E2) component